LSELWVCTVKT